MRAQAAVEFVMTYGWALLLILIMASAFAYFGIIEPSNIAPDRCVVSTGFTCGQYMLQHQDVGGPEIVLEIHNLLPETVTIIQNTFILECDHCLEGDDTSSTNTCFYDYGTGDQTKFKNNDFTIGSDKSFEVQCNPVGGNSDIQYEAHDFKARVRFSFDYMLKGKSFTHHAEGEIYSTVQG